MISTFRHRGLRRLFEDGDRRGVPPDLAVRLRRVLAILDAADDLETLDLMPGTRLHALKGRYQGYWSISISGNWRLVFRFEQGEMVDLDLVDYH